MSGMSLLLKNRVEIIPQTSRNRLENRSNSPENRVEIAPWTRGNRPENRSKSPDFTCNAFLCHFWPQGRPKATQDAPRPPKGGPWAAHGSPRDPISEPFSNQFSSYFRASFWDRVYFDLESVLEPIWHSFPIIFPCFFA